MQQGPEPSACIGVLHYRRPFDTMACFQWKGTNGIEMHSHTIFTNLEALPRPSALLACGAVGASRLTTDIKLLDKVVDAADNVLTNGICCETDRKL
jgi:hypothetical protein